MLTRQGWLVVVGGGVLLVLARLLGIGELYVLGACALALVVFAGIWVAVKRLELDVDRTAHPARVHAGGTSRVELRLRNLRTVTTPVLRLHEPVTGTPGAELLVPPLDRGAAAVASYRLPTDRRGLLRVGPLDVVVDDPFGLARTVLRAADEVDVTVYPRIEDIRPAPFTTAHDTMSGARQPHALGRAGDDFYALRPYVVGDDLRRIHWPSSARHDELLVRHQEQPWQGRTTVLLDVRRSVHDTDTFEAAVSAAASIVVANGGRRDLVRLVTSDGVDSSFGLGHAHMEALLEVLAVVKPTGSASLRATTELLLRGGGGALAAVLGRGAGDDASAVGRLRRRFGWVAIVRAETTGAPGSAPATVPTAVIGPGRPLAAGWDPLVGNGGGRGAAAAAAASRRTTAVARPTQPARRGPGGAPRAGGR